METKYRPEYGEALVEHSHQGLSPTAFAGKIGVSANVLRSWVQRYPEFAEAMDRARSARAACLEARGLDMLVNGCTGGQATYLQFLLKSAFPDDYHDRHEITGAGGKPLLEDADPARIAASIIELLRGQGGGGGKKPSPPKEIGFGEPDPT